MYHSRRWLPGLLCSRSCSWLHIALIPLCPEGKKCKYIYSKWRHDKKTASCYVSALVCLRSDYIIVHRQHSYNPHAGFTCRVTPSVTNSAAASQLPLTAAKVVNPLKLRQVVLALNQTHIYLYFQFFPSHMQTMPYIH